MVSKKEAAGVRTFVREQLSGEADLSTLTLGILKKRYLKHVKSDVLSPEVKTLMKQVVEEELEKMQKNESEGNCSESDKESKKPQNKRKREEDNDDTEVFEEREDESKAKRLRTKHSSSSSESEDKADHKTGSDDSDDEQSWSDSSNLKQEVKKSKQIKIGGGKRRSSSDDATDEEINASKEKKGPKKVVKKKNGDSKSEAKEESDEQNESDADSKSEKSHKNSGSESSDDGEEEEKVQVDEKKKKKPDPDSDSSSSTLPSLDDEERNGSVKKQVRRKKTKGAKKESNDGDRAVNRLKRYIALCGVKKNYKKLLENCHSDKSKVAVLKKELEDLGIHGVPSIKKCKRIKKQREEAQELASLDVNNIITTQGRPRRRGPWQEQPDPPPSAYRRSLNSGSDSDQDSSAPKGRKKLSAWTNLQGLISDDGDSD